MQKLTNQNLKPLPDTPSKKEVYQMYPHFPKYRLRMQIHTIQKANKNSIHKQVLSNIEFKELIAIIGEPTGYKTTD